MAHVPTILLVDDEVEILATLKSTIERHINPARVLTASTGERALTLLREHRVDIIVSDQRMPGMMGLDLLAEARKRAPGVMRVMLTGYAELDLVSGVVNDAKVERLLTKPVSGVAFVGHIRALLAEQNKKNEENLDFIRTLRETAEPFRGAI